MATGTNGIATYNDCTNFAGSSPSVSVNGYMCPTYNNIVTYYSLLDVNGSYNGNQCVKYSDLELGFAEFNMYNWAWANYESATGYNHTTLTSFNNSSALPKKGQLAGVTNAGNAFQECMNLTDISPFANVVAYNTNVSFYRMFYNCIKLTDISVVNSWNVYNVNNFSYMFSYCSNLTNISPVANWNMQTTNRRDFSGLFAHCVNLTNVSAISSWKPIVSNMAFAFDGLVNLTGDNLNISNWNVYNCINFYAAFRNCTLMYNIRGLANLNSYISANIEMGYMFANCHGLTVLYNTNTWNMTYVWHMEAMFSNCYTLANINGLNTWNVRRCTNMASLFSGCNTLSNISQLANWNVANLQNCAYMFNNCQNLTNMLPIRDWNAPNITNMIGTFMNCTNITNVQLQYWNFSNTFSFVNAFRNCKNLTTVNFPNTVGKYEYTNFANAFRDCNNLTGSIYFYGNEISSFSGCFEGTNAHSKTVYCYNRTTTYDSLYYDLLGGSTSNSYYNITLRTL